MFREKIGRLLKREREGNSFGFLSIRGLKHSSLQGTTKIKIIIIIIIITIIMNCK
jgi:hypothetical protein